MTSKNNALSLLARNLDATGDVTADAIASTVSLGASVYDSVGLLPYVGNNAGDQAFVSSTNRLYLWAGTGWYNVALINRAPTIASVLDSDNNSGPFALAIDGTATTITITAADSDGDPITYSATADSDFNGLATLSQDSSVFTITPFSQDSATTESGTITFKATDGVNIASSGVQTFTINFVSALWDEAVLSIGTSSTNSLDNSTFIDRSTNAQTVTTSGSPIQTAFHPYLDNWSVYFSQDYLTVPHDTGFDFGTGDFTVELWYHPFAVSSQSSLVGTYGNNGSAGWLAQYREDTQIFRFSNGNTAILDVNYSLTYNQWYHLAWVRNSGTLTLYLNGTSIGSTTDSTNLTYTSPVTIGRLNHGSVSQYTYGNLQDVRIIKGTALYTANFTPPTQKLTAVSGTSLLTCQSNRFIDNSTNAHTITVNGDPKVSAFNALGQESEYAAGENKGSVFSSGDSSYLNVSGGSWLTLDGDFDISFWYYSIDLTTERNILLSTYHSDTAGWILQTNTAGEISLSLTGDGADLTTTSCLVAHNWHHIRFSRNSGVVKVHVDGVEVGSVSSSGTFTYSNTFVIGNLGANRSPYNNIDGQEGYISDLVFKQSTPTSYDVPTAPVGNTNASLYLPFDNAGIFDKTGNHILTLFENTSTSTSQTKFADTAIYFDRPEDYILAGENQLYDNDFTIELWWYPTSDERQAIFHGSRGNDWSIAIDYRSTVAVRTIGIWASSNGSSWNLINSDNGGNGVGSETINQNAWNHIAYTREGTTWRLFVNGVLDVELTGISGSIARPTQQIAIGSWWTQGQMSNLKGYVENFQILKGVAKYTSNFTPPILTQGRTYQAES